MIVFAVWNKDYMSFFVKLDDGTSFSVPVRKRGEAASAAPWSPVYDAALSFLAEGGRVNLPSTPLPTPPPPMLPDSAMVARDAALAAGGSAKQRRDLKRLAAADPVSALILNGGLK